MTRANRLSHKDMLFSALPLTSTYALSLTMAAIFANASIALNSVAGEKVDLRIASTSIKPTIVIASSETVNSFYTNYIKQNESTIGYRTRQLLPKQALANGNMPPMGPTVGLPLMNLLKMRLLLIAQPDTKESPITSNLLHRLRLATRSRIAYALTSARVFGAVTQTHILDYRDKGDVVCVGPPLPSLELWVSGEDERVSAKRPHGKVGLYLVLFQMRVLTFSLDIRQRSICGWW